MIELDIHIHTLLDELLRDELRWSCHERGIEPQDCALERAVAKDATNMHMKPFKKSQHFILCVVRTCSAMLTYTKGSSASNTIDAVAKTANFRYTFPRYLKYSFKSSNSGRSSTPHSNSHHS